MKYLSICSGIEAATVAWHGFGWEPVGFSEIEPFPSAVLKHHYPEVPNLGDMTKFKEWQVDAFDVLVGGTPCQAFSVAGLRQSLDDARGNLSLVFCEMADHFDPPYILWENVPGVLNTKDNAFGCFLAGLAGEDVPLVAPGGKWTNAGFVLGPKRNVAWRILDAQYFGLAQRRRRVFVVACTRDGADPCEILFEREGVQRHSAPSREKGEGASHDVAPCIGASGRGFERGGDTRGQDPVVACFGGNNTSGQIEIATTRVASGTASGRMDFESETFAVCITGHTTHALKAEGHDGSEDGTGRGHPVIAIQERAICENPLAGPDGVGVRTDDCAYTLEARTVPQAVAFHQNQRAEVTLNDTAGSLKVGGGKPGQGYPAVAIGWSEELTASKELAGTLQYGGQGGRHDGVMTPAMQVRRLTPVECERLQGFPDGYTAIPWRNKPAEDCPDGPRYKALGNSMAVPCMRWIGWRIGKTQAG